MLFTKVALLTKDRFHTKLFLKLGLPRQVPIPCDVQDNEMVRVPGELTVGSALFFLHLPCEDLDGVDHPAGMDPVAEQTRPELVMLPKGKYEDSFHWSPCHLFGCSKSEANWRRDEGELVVPVKCEGVGPS